MKPAKVTTRSLVSPYVPCPASWAKAAVALTASRTRLKQRVQAVRRIGGAV
jgi:hypothetical protein